MTSTETASLASRPDIGMAPRTSTPTARIPALDVLRGFALCGIIFVNIETVGRFSERGLPTLQDPSGWLQLLVHQRFFPIFSLLFGMGFSLFLTSAGRRSARPRLVLARRLLVLLPLGVLHQVMHPGEALTFYAIFGLLVLLPSSWLPRWAVAAGAAVLLPLSVALAGGGWVLIPALFLLGSALVRYGVVDRLGASTRGPLLLLLGFSALAVPATVWQLSDLGNSGFSVSSSVAGLALAGTYVTGILVLLRTSLARVLQRVFTPLGRMALTNYLTATPVMFAAGRILGWQDGGSWTQVLVVAAGILVLQWGFSTLWLRRFRQGPLEWLWRSATWLQASPLRR